MFPLFQKEAYGKREKQLGGTDALSASLRHGPRDPVVRRYLDEIAIDLSGAKMRMNATRPLHRAKENRQSLHGI